jgi:hypothetical protein
MKKAELLERARGAHAEFVGALEGWDEERAARVGVNPRWSVKDVLAHIAAWEAEGSDVIARLRAGQDVPNFDRGLIDGFNAAAVEERRERTFAELRAEYDEAHRRVVAALEGLPEEVDESSREYRFAEIVAVIHPAHHAAQIEEWRKKIRDEG